MIEYTVHSCVVAAVPLVVTLGDSQVQAEVQGLVVEMVSSDEVHGHTFRFVPRGDEDMEQKKALFSPGNRVRCEFTQVEEA